MEERRGSPQEKHQQQQLTIFYNGNICVTDVTEFQVYVCELIININSFACTKIKRIGHVGW
jgi:hypothetical protein